MLRRSNLLWCKRQADEVYKGISFIYSPQGAGNITQVTPRLRSESVRLKHFSSLHSGNDSLTDLISSRIRFQTHKFVTFAAMKNTIDTLLFDLDDTLLIEWDSAKTSFIETVHQVDPLIDGEVFVKTIIEEARKIWYELPTIAYCRKVGISTWEALWADFTGEHEQLKLLRQYAPDYRFQAWHNTLIKFDITDNNTALTLSNEFIRIRNTKHILFPETREVLETFKTTYKLGLITNGTPGLQWKKIHGGDLKNYFQYIAISGEHNTRKPDTKIFETILHALNSEKGRTIMIGNSIDSDIKGAQNAGIKNVWINRNNHSADISPDHEIDNLLKLGEILEK